MKTRAKQLLQSIFYFHLTYSIFDFLFKVKIGLKYLDGSLLQSCSQYHVSNCLSLASIQKVKKSMQYHTGCKLSVYFSPSWFCKIVYYFHSLFINFIFILFISFYDCLYPYCFFFKPKHIIKYTKTSLQDFFFLNQFYCISVALFDCRRNPDTAKLHLDPPRGSLLAPPASWLLTAKPKTHSKVQSSWSGTA